MKETEIIEAARKLSGRWTIPILLDLEVSGGRFTPLQRKLEIAPARLSENLKQLTEQGVIEHLSPYERRHPLLPEYKLTDEGKHWRELALAIRSAEGQIQRGALSAKAWNIPVLLSLGFQYEHFQEIRRLLQQITPRALSLRLTELHEEGVVRKLLSELPQPSYIYRLTPSAQKPVHNLVSDMASLL